MSGKCFIPKLSELSLQLRKQSWSETGKRGCFDIIDQSTMIERVLVIIETRMVSVIRAKRPVAYTNYVDNEDGLGDVLIPQLHRQLKDYVGQISSMYRGVRYHSFMHATHVVISLNKMINMMTDEHRPKQRGIEKDGPIFSSTKGKQSSKKDLNAANCGQSEQHCFGLCNDPMAHFVLVFAALVHDVDHSGVCNKSLVEEGSELAILYNNLSIAEQNSLAIAFSILFEPSFEALRDAVFPAAEDYIRFMDEVNHLVIHTDLGSPKIKESKQLWNEKFGKDFDDESSILSKCENTNVGDERQKSLMMELLLQAADVAHNIQGWDNLVLWNHRLYDEMLFSFQHGKGDDPAPNWFKGQICFFDGYIIPLAKKLRQCGIFGKRGDKFLNCVLENRRRWLVEGEAVTRDFGSVPSIKRELSNAITSADNRDDAYLNDGDDEDDDLSSLSNSAEVRESSHILPIFSQVKRIKTER